MQRLEHIMLDWLPKRAGWPLIVVGALGIIAGGAAMLLVSLHGGWLLLAACLYLGWLLRLLRRGQVDYGIKVAAKLIFPAIVTVLLLESLARSAPTTRLLLGGSACIVLGTYLVHVGMLKLAGISTSYERE
jgi:hypothetical protein